MELLSVPIEGLVLFKPRLFFDDRGYFFESYQQLKLEQFGIKHPLFRIINLVLKKGWFVGCIFKSLPTRKPN